MAKYLDEIGLTHFWDNIKDQIGNASQEQVDAWLDDHPEATTTVQDGAVTTSKIANGAVTNAKLDPSGLSASFSMAVNDVVLLESGAFNDNTGEKTNNATRLRTVAPVPIKHLVSITPPTGYTIWLYERALDGSFIRNVGPWAKTVVIDELSSDAYSLDILFRYTDNPSTDLTGLISTVQSGITVVTKLAKVDANSHGVNAATSKLNTNVRDTSNMLDYTNPDFWHQDASARYQTFSDYIPSTSKGPYYCAVFSGPNAPVSTVYVRLFAYDAQYNELGYTDFGGMGASSSEHSFSFSGTPSYIRLRVSSNSGNVFLPSDVLTDNYSIYLGHEFAYWGSQDDVFGRYDLLGMERKDRLQKRYRDEVERVKGVCNAQKAGLSFVFATDIHVAREYDLYKMDIISECSEFVDFVVLNGDIIDGSRTAPVSDVRELLYESVSSAKNKTSEVFATFGNHDDNFYGVAGVGDQNLITGQQFLNMTNYGVSRKNVDPLNPYGNYYFVDFPQYKMRAIFLNSCNAFDGDTDDLVQGWTAASPFRFDNRQVLWCRDYALRFDETESDWGVIVFSHSNVLADSVVGYMNIANITTFSNVLKAFKDGGSYTELDSDRGYGDDNVFDFTEQGPHEVVCVMAGHVHYDCADVDDTYGIANIVTVCDKTIKESDITTQTPSTPINVRSAPDRQIGTLSSEAFDVVKIDRKNKQVICTRYGAGNNRTIQYA